MATKCDTMEQAEAEIKKLLDAGAERVAIAKVRPFLIHDEVDGDIPPEIWVVNDPDDLDTVSGYVEDISIRHQSNDSILKALKEML